MKFEPKAVGGTQLNAADLKRGKIFLNSFTPKLRYAWDTGEAIGRYLAELKEGRLIARSCRKCERVMIPPRWFASVAFAADNWVYVQNSAGELFTMRCELGRAPLETAGNPRGDRDRRRVAWNGDSPSDPQSEPEKRAYRYARRGGLEASVSAYREYHGHRVLDADAPAE